MAVHDSQGESIAEYPEEAPDLLIWIKRTRKTAGSARLAKRALLQPVCYRRFSTYLFAGPPPAANRLFLARLRSSVFLCSQQAAQIHRVAPILWPSPVAQWLPVLQNLLFTSPTMCFPVS
jgi:hypothetical protein